MRYCGMALTLPTTMAPATDLGYILHKNPGRIYNLDLSFGRAIGLSVSETETVRRLPSSRSRTDWACASEVWTRPMVAC
jgi:hypothetical protein